MKFDALMRKAYNKAQTKQKSKPEPVYTKEVVQEDGESSYEELYTDDEECDSLESELDEE